MKPKTLVLMVVAVTCGLGASYMTSRLLAERHEDTDKITVLVAKRALNTGEPIKIPQDLFEEKLYAKGEEPRDALTKFDELKGRVIKKALRPGDFIRAEDMLSAGDPATIFSYNLPQGFRAVGLRVNVESTAAGFATLPMSRVDVVQTVRRGDDKSSFSRVILENVLVLAADGRTQRGEDGGAMPAAVVVFALSPEDAMKVTLAKEMGPLSLMLRKFNDNGRTAVPVITAQDLGTDTVGIKDHSETASDGSPPGGGTGAGVDLLPLNKDSAKPAEAKVEVAVEKPQTTTHILTIIEGGSTRPISYELDSQKRVVNQAVTRSEIPVRPPSTPTGPTIQEKE